ncbi:MULTISPECIES: hypothetical protein [Sphingomonas]|uniref:hypothetical protein n=1 Tax=Sphingomonas TaxID=13687 RepID=UPI000DEF3F5E|nr:MULTISPECIES: hypothetical protein [Sphingomonas]
MSAGLCAWGFFYPRPYLPVLALLGLTPVIAVVAAQLSKGAIDLNKDEGPSQFLMLPPIVLALRLLLDFPLVDGWALFEWSLALGGLLTLIGLWLFAKGLPRGKEQWTLLLCGALGAICYAWALLALANDIFPQAAPEHFAVRVLDHRIGNGRHRSYYVTLPPFGPVKERDDWDVGRTAYEQVAVGKPICIDIYPGALREPWYDASACR